MTPYVTGRAWHERVELVARRIFSEEAPEGVAGPSGFRGIMWKRIKEFWPFFVEEKRKYILILLALLVVDIVDLMPPFVIKYYIDNLKAVFFKNTLIYYGTLLALSYVGFMVVMGIFRRIMSQNANRTAQVIANGIRRKYFTPSLVARARVLQREQDRRSDVPRHRGYRGGQAGLLDGLHSDIRRGIQPAHASPLLMGLNMRLTLYVFWFLPLVPLFVVRVGEVIHRRFERVQAKMADVSACAQENISGVRVMKAYAQENHVRGEFEKLSEEYAGENVGLAKWTSLLFPTLLLSIGIAQSIALIGGGWRVLIGEMSYWGSSGVPASAHEAHVADNVSRMVHQYDSAGVRLDETHPEDHERAT